MKNLLLLFTLAIWTNIHTSAQDVSLEVDCQNPGWLSNMINYTEQQTVKNIKVTGFINSSDLSFLGSLNGNHQLNGVINLEDVQIVGTSTEDNNKITQGYFSNHIQHLILPKALVSASKCLEGTSYDTVTIGGETLPIISSGMFYSCIYQNDGIKFNKNVKHLILREGVTTISRCAFYNGATYQASPGGCIFESISFPTSLVSIKELAFQGCYALKKADFTDNIEEIDQWAFAGLNLFSNNDTIILPSKLKHLYLNSFAKECKAWTTTGEVAPCECYGNQHFYIPKSVEIVDCSYVRLFGAYEKCYLHLANDNPPTLSGAYSGTYQYLIVYVPKNSVEIYKSDPIWKKTTILAEPNPATSINIEENSIEMIKGSTRQLFATVLPTDADDKGFTWSTSNSNIISVSQNGLVSAIASGEARVYATLNVDQTIFDYCTVNVYQPVTGIGLNTNSKSVKVGETFNLEANIIPSDADNKNVVWSSENTELASVVDGIVKAHKPGIVKIYASSEYDNQISAYCEVTISQPVTGVNLNYNTYELNNIGDLVQLEAIVTPEDASNKEVNWRSSNENVCIVSNGSVVAVGYGTSVIIATTKDGGYMATCTITVKEPTEIDAIKTNATIIDKIYTLDGRPSSLHTKGTKIIVFPNGDVKKFVVK